MTEMSKSSQCQDLVLFPWKRSPMLHVWIFTLLRGSMSHGRKGSCMTRAIIVARSLSRPHQGEALWLSQRSLGKKCEFEISCPRSLSWRTMFLPDTVCVGRPEVFLIINNRFIPSITTSLDILVLNHGRNLVVRRPAETIL